MYWHRVLFISMLLVLGLACKKQPDNSASFQATGADDSLWVGEVDSMTGNEATFGTSTHQGIELAIEGINSLGGIRNKKLRLFSLDIQGKPDEGARAITRIAVQGRALAILTGAASSHVLAMAPIAQKNRVPLITTSATNEKITEHGNYIFRACFIDSFQGQIMAKFARSSLKIKRVAVLRDVKSDHSTGLANAFSSAFLANGGEVISEQSYSGGDIDFKSQLTALRAKLPEAIFVPGYYTDVSLIVRQARELGIKVPFLGGDGWDSTKLKEIAGSALNGSFYTTFYSGESPSHKIQEFKTKYLARYKSEPDGVAVMAYESIQILAEALRKAKSFEIEEIRSALSAQKAVDVLTGSVFLNSKRDAVRPAIIMKIDEKGDSHYFTTFMP